MALLSVARYLLANVVARERVSAREAAGGAWGFGHVGLSFVASWASMGKVWPCVLGIGGAGLGHMALHGMSSPR